MLRTFDPPPAQETVVWSQTLETAAVKQAQLPAPPLARDNAFYGWQDGRNQRRAIRLTERLFELLVDAGRPMTREEMAAALKVKKTTIRFALNNLRRNGHARAVDKWYHNSRLRQRYEAVTRDIEVQRAHFHKKGRPRG